MIESGRSSQKYSQKQLRNSKKVKRSRRIQTRQERELPKLLLAWRCSWWSSTQIWRPIRTRQDLWFSIWRTSRTPGWKSPYSMALSILNVQLNSNRKNWRVNRKKPSVVRQYRPSCRPVEPTGTRNRLATPTKKDSSSAESANQKKRVTSKCRRVEPTSQWLTSSIVTTAASGGSADQLFEPYSFDFLKLPKIL